MRSIRVAAAFHPGGWEAGDSEAEAVPEAADSAVSAAVRPAAEARAGGGRFENTPV